MTHPGKIFQHDRFKENADPNSISAVYPKIHQNVRPMFVRSVIRCLLTDLYIKIPAINSLH